MDVIAMHAAGVTNAVATLGTAITPEQARLIARYTKKVVLSYDSDEAGQRATARALALLEEVGLTVQVLHIEGAKDPDEYLKKFGVDSFRRLIDGSRTKFEFNLNRVLSRHDISQPQEKIAASKALCELISGFYSSAEREVYIAEVAKRLEIEPAGIRNDVNRAIGRRRKEEKREQIDNLKKTAVGYGDRINPDRAKAPGVANCEDTVLSLLLLYPNHRALAAREDVHLTEEDFFTAFAKRVYSYVADNGSAQVLDSAMMNERFTPEEIGRITELRVKRMDLTENGDRALLESIAALRSAVRRQNGISAGVTTLSDLDSLIRARREGDNN